METLIISALVGYVILGAWALYLTSIISKQEKQLEEWKPPF